MFYVIIFIRIDRSILILSSTLISSAKNKVQVAFTLLIELNP